MRRFRVSGDHVDEVRDGLVAPVVLVLPGADVQMRRVTLDARSYAQAESAARYLLADTLAADDADVHVALGDVQNASGDRLVAVMSRARLAAWIEACGGDPVAVYVDFTLWPTPEGAVDAVDRGPLSLVAAGPAGGFAIESDLAPALLRRWLETSGASITRLRADRDSSDIWRAAANDLRFEELKLETRVDDLLARAAARPPAYAPDLLQGAFAPKPKATGGAGFWRFATALVMLAFAVHTGAEGFAAWRDSRAAKATLELAERDLRAARPDVTRVVNLRAQVTAMKADLARSAAHPVLALNPALVDALKSSPSVRLDEVRHFEPGKEVKLIVSSTSPEALDAFEGALRNANVTAVLEARSPRGGRHAAEIRAQAP